MSPQEWEAAARQAVLDVAAEHVQWTSDEVWEVLEARGVPAPENPRLLGNVLGAMQRQGLIEKQAVPARPSRRAVRNHGSVAVWSTPGMAWLVPDALPCSRAVRGMVEQWAADNALTVAEAVDRLLKEATGRLL